MLSMNDLSSINDPSKKIWGMTHLCDRRDSDFNGTKRIANGKIGREL